MALEKSFIKFFQIEAAAMSFRDNMNVLVVVKSMDSKLDRMETMGVVGGFGGFCDVPSVRDFVVGFDEPLRELKLKILEGQEQVVVISAPGGCGKTTLAKMVCHDPQIKGTFL